MSMKISPEISTQAGFRALIDPIALAMMVIAPPMAINIAENPHARQVVRAAGSTLICDKGATAGAACAGAAATGTGRGVTNLGGAVCKTMF